VGAAKGFLWWEVTARRDSRMQPTPLCGDKIGAILAARCDKNAFPIYQCGTADGHTVRRQFIIAAFYFNVV
jgi:hypothetical protein